MTDGNASQNTRDAVSGAADDMRFGCLFCQTGAEDSVVKQLESRFSELEAISPVKLRYRRARGEAVEERVLLLPGYVFFRTAGDIEPRELRRLDRMLRLLTYSDNGDDWPLHGFDEQFAREMFRSNGVIGFSKAFYDEGDRIRIVEGFLKAYEGSIIRVNRRSRTAQIRVELQDKVMTLWLGFELIETK